ncbi:MAG: T9SS type A sorting domain-containing protein [Chitinispirillaceae bacterium]|nr:T9SS type A sorting domain-containing protein [Chitinispirillaceae bacterium]
MTCLTLLFCAISSSAQWVQTGGPEGGRIHAFCVADSNNFAGTGGGVFVSTDKGASWTSVNSGLTNLEVNCLAVNESSIFAGTYGNSIWCRPLSDFTMANTISVKHLKKHTALNAFFTGAYGSKAAIVFTIDRRQHVRFAVYDLSGYIVQSLADKQFESGPQTISWKAKSLAPGCYLVKMQTEGNTIVRNFTMIR